MLNIAIDGPAGAGKSTIAKLIAKQLNIIYLDTGAMYRACAYHASRNGISVHDVDAVLAMMDSISLNIDYDPTGAQHVYVNGEDVTPYIREHSISQMASDISKIHEVRLKLVEMQRDFAAKHSCVLDGRDITSFVLKDCVNKFYLDASIEVRARRRCLELEQKGQAVSFEDMCADIARRDHNDMSRDFAPLVRVADAIYIDTSDMTREQVLQAVISQLK